MTVCDRGEGGQKSSKKAWHTLWTATAPNNFVFINALQYTIYAYYFFISNV